MRGGHTWEPALARRVTEMGEGGGPQQRAGTHSVWHSGEASEVDIQCHLRMRTTLIVILRAPGRATPPHRCACNSVGGRAWRVGSDLVRA